MKKFKGIIPALGVAFVLAGPLATPADAFSVSDVFHKAKDAVVGLKDDIKSALSKVKNGTLKLASKAFMESKKFTSWVQTSGPKLVKSAFDKAVPALKGLSGDALKAGKFMLEHRDVLEKAVLFGIEHGKTVADITLDIAGVIPVANVPVAGLKTAMDVMWGPVTSAIKLGIEADQKLLLGNEDSDE